MGKPPPAGRAQAKGARNLRAVWIGTGVMAALVAVVALESAGRWPS